VDTVAAAAAAAAEDPTEAEEATTKVEGAFYKAASTQARVMSPWGSHVGQQSRKAETYMRPTFIL